MMRSIYGIEPFIPPFQGLMNQPATLTCGVATGYYIAPLRGFSDSGFASANFEFVRDSVKEKGRLIMRPPLQILFQLAASLFAGVSW
jgi:hypothetical protein